MNTSKPILYAAAGVLFVAVLSGIVWYRLPIKVENLNRMLYCACGYAEVEFKNGIVTMVSYHHANPKPGDIVGSYSVTGNSVEMTIIFNGTTHKETMELDHVGLIAPAPAFQKYQAIDGDSRKINVYHLLSRIRI